MEGVDLQGLQRLFRDLSSLLRLLTILIATIVPLPHARAAGPKVMLNIPAGDASKTLFEFYVQSQVQLLYMVDAVKGVQTQEVVGEYEASEGLARMLEGTSLTFEFESDNAALVRPVLSQSAGRRGAPRPTSGPVNVPQSQLQSPAVGPNASELVVTGSYIRGVLDLTSPLEFVGRRQMKNTAYATVQDAMQMLPVNAGMMQGEDFAGNNNLNRGSSINLRGLGSGATLVLINGRRQPYAGLQADFVDVSNVPWSIVERIEVLPDGSSALYGSDAIAGVVNIILRDELEGAETSLRFATAPDGAAEKFAAQLFGRRWGSGKWLAAYQYVERSVLLASDRVYSANADKRPLGGSNFSTTRSIPGNILDPQTLQPVFAIPSGQDGTALTAADLLPGVVNVFNQLSTFELLPEKKSHSLYLTASQALGERVELFGEARFNRRDTESAGSPIEQLLFVPASNPFFVEGLFGNSPVAVVAYNFAKDLGPTLASAYSTNMTGVLGANADLGGEWQGSLSVSYGEEHLHFAARNLVDGAAVSAALADTNPLTAFNPFGDGSYANNPATLDAIRSVQLNRAISDIGSANFVADGPLFDLPTGVARLAVGLERRQENLYREIRNLPYQFGREVSAAFAELSVPLVGNGDEEAMPPRVELSLAGRYEKYSDFGDTRNPRIGLHWAPSNSIKLRTSWGTSFKAPKLLDLYDTSQNLTTLLMLPDPQAGGLQSLAIGQQGSSPDLNEETAVTWTAGVDLAPEQLPGLTVSLTGYDIEYRDQVIQPSSGAPFDILRQEDRWAAAITRNPSRELVDALCNRSDLLGSRAQCLASSPAVFVDYRLRNMASTHVRGVDLNIDQVLDTRLGRFDLSLDGSYLFSFEQAVTAQSPLIDIVDTVGNPLALRLRGAVEWNQHGEEQSGLNGMLGVGYTGGYRHPGSMHPEVGSLTTVDLRLGYRTAAGRNWWDGVEVALNVVNVFDEDPPFVDQFLGYDPINAEPTGRVIGVYLQKRWGSD